MADVLRKETVGGLLLLAATVVALVWANSPWRFGYASVRDAVVGPASVHLDLSLGRWAADGLLAIFFFVAGLELKREFVAGGLRDIRRAAVPVAAAVGGVVTPALLFVVVNLAGGVAMAAPLRRRSRCPGWQRRTSWVRSPVRWRPVGCPSAWRAATFGAAGGTRHQRSPAS